MPRPASRSSVMVELRTSTSISPDCRARKRCWAESGTNLVLVASPSTAAATAPHISTSRPFHLPWLSGSEKPPKPTLTPQITWPRFFTTSKGRRRLSRCRQDHQRERYSTKNSLCYQAHRPLLNVDQG